jgi:hypothetical protein
MTEAMKPALADDYAAIAAAMRPEAVPTGNGELVAACRRFLADFSAIAACMQEPNRRVADPVLALYRHWRTMEDACQVAEKRHKEMRTGFVVRHGDLASQWSRSILSRWEADPAHAELGALCAEVDRLNEAAYDIVEEMMVTPATSLAGIIAKLKVGLDIWPKTKPPDALESHEEVAYAVMEDALRVLSAPLLPHGAGSR